MSKSENIYSPLEDEDNQLSNSFAQKLSLSSNPRLKEGGNHKHNTALTESDEGQEEEQREEEEAEVQVEEEEVELEEEEAVEEAEPEGVEEAEEEAQVEEEEEQEEVEPEEKEEFEEVEEQEEEELKEEFEEEEEGQVEGEAEPEEEEPQVEEELDEEEEQAYEDADDRVRSFSEDVSPRDALENDDREGDPEDFPEEGEEPGDEDDIEIYEGLEENYELGKEIGSGGYSIVYEARDKQTDEWVAVKSIDMSIFDNENDAGCDPLKPLKSEIRTMQRINHPNIIKLYKVFLDDEKFYIVMELMPDCEELFQRIERVGFYDEDQACFIFRQLVSAVEYLHTKLGIAHRDLKPENLLMCGSGPDERLKLADFGFAKHFKEEQMKTALGSPGYAAPELFTDDTYNEKVDMWSLGVILYLILSGFPPFYGATIKELTDRIIHCEYDFDDPSFDEVSEEAKNVVSRLLVKNPSLRFSAKELLDSDWLYQ